jgi:hypothetical protein
MIESQAMIPWWVINTFGDDRDPEFGSLRFSSLLSHQLERWSRRSGVIESYSGKWWHIDTLDLPQPETPVALHHGLYSFVRNAYPLRRHEGQPPAISGAIDNNELRIALVGDVRDRLTRTYLHCMGKFIRLNALTLLDPIDIKLFAFLSIPHDAHLQPDRDEIAVFLAELHTMMLQPPAHRPFDWVFITQDKNNSPLHRRSGYGHLASGELAELMAQTLFHVMISGGQTLRDIAAKYSPPYLSAGAVSFYYDWGQHKQRLAEQTSRELFWTFTTSTEPPFIDTNEAETAHLMIQGRFRAQQLLDELVSVSSGLAKELPPVPQMDEDASAPPETGDLPPPAEPIDPFLLYREAVRRSEQRIEEGRDILWKGGFAFRSTERTIIESVQGIFVGEYGAGDARGLEQALLVLGRLEASFEVERYEAQARVVNEAALTQILKAFDLHIEPAPPPEDVVESGGGTLPAIALLQFTELLSTIPLWIKVAAGLLFGGSTGYALYRKVKARRVASTRPPAERLPFRAPKREAETQRLHDELRGKVQNSLGSIYFRAIRLIKKLELFIIEVREKAKRQAVDFPPVYAYETTAFCRSVFDELAVPGRLPLRPLITNGSFAPPLLVNDRLIKFKDFEKEELCALINTLLDERPKEALPRLAPSEIGEADPAELGAKSARELPIIFYDFASDLYERSAPLSMDDALRYIKGNGGEERLLSFASEAAAPPVIFNRGSVTPPDPYVEFKYHDRALLDEVFGDRLDGLRKESRTRVEHINDGDLLSFAVYQPIPTSRQGEFHSLDSIHTVSAMRGPLPVSATPSLVFTLGTLSSDDSTLTAHPALINPTDGVRLLTPERVEHDVSLFRRDLIKPLYDIDVRRRPAPLPESEFDDLIILEDEAEAAPQARAAYDVMAVAGIKDHPADSPFRIGAEYVLQAGFKSTLPEGFAAVSLSLPPDEETFEFHITVHAEGMSIRPNWIQALTVNRSEEAPSVEFRLSPNAEGHKVIRVDFYYHRHWMAHVRLEVEVTNAPEPVFAA